VCRHNARDLNEPFGIGCLSFKVCCCNAVWTDLQCAVIDDCCDACIPYSLELLPTLLLCCNATTSTSAAMLKSLYGSWLQSTVTVMPKFQSSRLAVMQ
jgi:hypothetical protein